MVIYKEKMLFLSQRIQLSLLTLMRKLTYKEKGLIDNLIGHSNSSTSFSIYDYVSKQKFYSKEQLLEIAFLLWLLEENGYVYITPAGTVFDGGNSNDPNIQRSLSLLNNPVRQRVEALLSSLIYVTDQLRSLKDSDYQTIEEQELDHLIEIHNDVITQTQEAQNQTNQALLQTKEAQKQTAEALKQTTEAESQTKEALQQTKNVQEQLINSKKQTKFAFWAFLLSFLTFLSSIIVPHLLPKSSHIQANPCTDNSIVFDSASTQTPSSKPFVPVNDSTNQLSKCDSICLQSKGGAKEDMEEH